MTPESTVCEIILTGNSQKTISWELIFHLGTMKIDILSPERHT